MFAKSCAQGLRVAMFKRIVVVTFLLLTACSASPAGVTELDGTTYRWPKMDNPAKHPDVETMLWYAGKVASKGLPYCGLVDLSENIGDHCSLKSANDKASQCAREKFAAHQPFYVNYVTCSGRFPGRTELEVTRRTELEVIGVDASGQPVLKILDRDMPNQDCKKLGIQTKVRITSVFCIEYGPLLR